MNKFMAGILAGVTVGAASLALMSDRSIRNKVLDKSEDMLEKAENFAEKYKRR